MFDETLFQSSRAGVPFVDILKEQGILPGIKVDTGLQPIDGTDGETATQGLDGLAERCQRLAAFSIHHFSNYLPIIMSGIQLEQGLNEKHT